MSSSNAPSDPPPRASLAAELDAAFGEDETDSDSATAAFLVGLMGNNAGKLYRIPKGESIIGRSSRAFLTLQEKGVSHQHARLTLSSKGCTITDLESTNGTRVNDVRIQESQQLMAGDVIRLGQATLGFLTDAEDEQQHTRALARATQPHQGLLSAMPTNPNALVPTPSNNPAGQNTQGFTQGQGYTQGQYTQGTGAQLIQRPPEHGGVIPVHPTPTLSNNPPSATDKLDSLLDKATIIFRFLGRYGWLLVFSALGLATLFAATVALSPPLAVASFEVFLREDPAARSPVPEQVGFFEFAEKDFSNGELVKETLQEVGVEPTPEEINRAAGALTLEQLSRASPFFEGKYQHPDRDFAKRFLAAHLKNFLEYEISEAIGAKLANVRLLRQQYKENHERLLAAEEQLRDFKQEHLSALPDQAAQQLGSRVELLSQRDMLTAQLDRSSRELALAQSQLNSQEWMAGSQINRSAPYETALSDVRTKIAGAKAKGYAEGHPELQKLRDEEKEYLRLKNEAITSAPTDTEREADAEYRALKSKVGQLKVSVAATRKELGLVHSRLAEIAEIATEMPGVEAEVSEKMRQVEVSKKLHDQLFSSLKAKELDLELERNNVRSRYEVIKSPRASIASPVQTAMKRAMMGGAMGLVLGLLAAMVHWLYRYAKNRNQVVTAPVASTRALARTELPTGDPMQKVD